MKFRNFQIMAVLILGLVGCSSPTSSTPTSTYTVTFDSNGGSAVVSQTVKDGGKVTKPSDPSKSGNTFSGWTHGGVAYDFDSAVTADITITATWTLVPAINHTVTFDSNGGSVVASQTINDGAKVTKPSDPTNGVHNFLGWYNGSVAFDFSTAVTSDLTLTAKWTNTVVVEDTVRYESAITYDALNNNYTYTGAVIMDMNALTFSNVKLSTKNNTTDVLTTYPEGTVNCTGTFVVDATGITFTFVTYPGFSSYVGQSTNYLVSGSDWKWHDVRSLFGFGNTHGDTTTVTKTVLTSHTAEQ